MARRDRGRLGETGGHAEESFLSETNDGETTHTEKPGRWVSESFSPFPFSEAIRERDMDTQDTQDTHTTSRFRLEPRGFDALVDEHFASIERAAHLRARERSARDAVKKADKVKKDQERRAADLLREEAREETRATLIEYNLEKVDAVIAAVNSLLRSGQSWDEIERIVDDERRAGNPVARLVRKLDLANDAVRAIFERRGFAVAEAVGGDADGDLARMVFAATFVPSGGGFSALIAGTRRALLEI